MKQRTGNVLSDAMGAWLDSYPVRRACAAAGIGKGPGPSSEIGVIGVESAVPGFERFHLVGNNWSESASAKPVAVLFGFLPWKREFVAGYLPDHRVAFVRRNMPWRHIQQALDRQTAPEIIIWGLKEVERIEDYARSRNLALSRMEDGFIRSSRLGSQRSFPMSLVLDRSGIYFDATRPSDLESLLETGDLDDPALIARARTLIGIIAKYGISKYNPDPAAEPKAGQPGQKKRLLVIGQVEDDASVRFGCPLVASNAELVEFALRENPGAEIVFRPHPDVLAGRRPGEAVGSAISAACGIDTSAAPASEALRSADHVYTISSLLGFEALLLGKKVTTLGVPFYAGWGLTDDRVACERRTRRRSIEQLFAAAYILYPRYRSGADAAIGGIEDAIGALLDLRLAAIAERGTEGEAALDRGTAEYLGSHLPKRGRFIQDCLKEAPKGIAAVEPLVEKYAPEAIAHFGLVASIFKDGFDYDALKAWCDAAVGEFNRRVAGGSLDAEAIKSFLTDLHFAYRWLNGRSPAVMPVVPPRILGTATDEQLALILPPYFRILVATLQYGEARQAIEQSGNRAARLMPLLAKTLNERPIRIERNGHDRVALAESMRAWFRQATPRPRLWGDRFLEDLRFALMGDDLESAVALVAGNRPALAALAARNWLGRRGRPQEASSWTAAGAHDLNKLIRMLFGKTLHRGKTEHAETLYRALSRYMTGYQRERYHIRLAMVKRDYAEAAAVYRDASDQAHAALDLRMAHARALRLQGGFERSEAELERLQRDGGFGLHKNRVIRDDLAKIKFFRRASAALAAVPRGPALRGAVFLSSIGDLHTIAMALPALIALKRRGYAVVHLTRGILAGEPSGEPSIDRFEGAIPLDMERKPLANAWRLDWEGGAMECDGVNYYQGLFERLSTKYRRFTLDVSDPAIADFIADYLSHCDQCVSVMKEMRASAEGIGLPFVFLSGGYHVAPYSAFRDFCLALPRGSLLSFAAISPAYDNYYSNLSEKFASAISVANLSTHKPLRASYLAIPEKFEQWYARYGHTKRVSGVAEAQLAVNRSGKGARKPGAATSKFIADARATGKTVICCFGKMMCDLGVPYDGGPAHRNMVDWLAHTIATVKGRDDVAVLVKPHPHELRKEIALDLTEFLRDALPRELPGNVRFLDHAEFGTAEIARHVDLAVLWNGTASVELTVLGTPVLMCSHFGRHDYPLGLIYPESRAQYERYILGGEFPAPSQSTRKRAAALLAYAATDGVSLPQLYSRRAATNDSVGVPLWDEKRLEAFQANGDPYMETAASRIVEGIGVADAETGYLVSDRAEDAFSPSRTAAE